MRLHRKPPPRVLEAGTVANSSACGRCGFLLGSRHKGSEILDPRDAEGRDTQPRNQSRYGSEHRGKSETGEHDGGNCCNACGRQSCDLGIAAMDFVERAASDSEDDDD